MSERGAAEVVASLGVADVLKAYTGRPGCMCGCKGAYRVTRAGRTEASSGSYTYEEDEVDDAFVAQTLGKIQTGALPLDGAPPLLRYSEVSEAGTWHVDDDLSYVIARCREKVYAVYLTRAARLARGALARTKP